MDQTTHGEGYLECENEKDEAKGPSDEPQSLTYD